MTVGVLVPAPARAEGGGLRLPIVLYRRLVRWKANPRTDDYMRERFAEVWPEGELLVHGVDPWERAVAGATEVVLVYPDAIGLWHGGVERTVRRRATVPVTVLNGRRRVFPLDARTRRQLGLRRVLERTMAGDLAATAVVLVVAPFLLVADLVRGRR